MEQEAGPSLPPSLLGAVGAGETGEGVGDGWGREEPSGVAPVLFQSAWERKGWLRAGSRCPLDAFQALLGFFSWTSHRDGGTRGMQSRVAARGGEGPFCPASHCTTEAHVCFLRESFGRCM